LKIYNIRIYAGMPSFCNASVSSYGN
jgi:hypothetical protein